jgi:hypothetical protein
MRRAGARVHDAWPVRAERMVAQKEMAQLGISSVDVAKKLGDGPGGRGLAGTLNYLSQTVLKKMGPSGWCCCRRSTRRRSPRTTRTVEFNALAPSTQKVAKQFIDGSITAKDWIAKAVKAMTPRAGEPGAAVGDTENNSRGFQQALRTACPGRRPTPTRSRR